MFNNDAVVKGIWRAKVVDRQDPDENRRIKVFVKPIHEGISTQNLPWAVPREGGSIGGSPTGDQGYGEGGVPEKDSWVFVKFEQGDPMSPRWLGSAQPADSVPKRFRGEQDSAYDDIESNKVSGTVTEKSTQTGSYPDIRGWVLNSGIVIEMDESGPRILVYHPSGFRYEVLSSGDVVEHVEGVSQKIATSDMEQSVGGDKIEEVSGDSEETVSGSKTIDAGGATIRMENGNIYFN